MDDLFTPEDSGEEQTLSTTPILPVRRRYLRKSTHTKDCPKHPCRELFNFALRKRETDKRPNKEMPQRKQKRNTNDKREFMRRNIEEQGVWVQCVNVTCRKWRFLNDVTDPAKVPPVWTCDMHPDPVFDSCDKVEQDYSTLDFIHNQFTEGSVVWARMHGYPWWPALVESDPDEYEFMRYTDITNEVTHYHVTFLDSSASRSWVPSNAVKKFDESGTPPGSLVHKKVDFTKRLQPARERALAALQMPIKERIDTYGFSKTFKGPWKCGSSRSRTQDQGSQTEESSIPEEDRLDLSDMLSNEDMKEILDDMGPIIGAAAETVFDFEDEDPDGDATAKKDKRHLTTHQKKGPSTKKKDSVSTQKKPKRVAEKEEDSKKSKKHKGKKKNHKKRKREETKEERRLRKKMKKEERKQKEIADNRQGDENKGEKEAEETSCRDEKSRTVKEGDLFKGDDTGSVTNGSSLEDKELETKFERVDFHEANAQGRKDGSLNHEKEAKSAGDVRRPEGKDFNEKTEDLSPQSCKIGEAGIEESGPEVYKDKYDKDKETEIEKGVPSKEGKIRGSLDPTVKNVSSDNVLNNAGVPFQKSDGPVESASCEGRLRETKAGNELKDETPVEHGKEKAGPQMGSSCGNDSTVQDSKNVGRSIENENQIKKADEQSSDVHQEEKNKIVEMRKLEKLTEKGDKKKEKKLTKQEEKPKKEVMKEEKQKLKEEKQKLKEEKLQAKQEKARQKEEKKRLMEQIKKEKEDARMKREEARKEKAEKKRLNKEKKMEKGKGDVSTGKDHNSLVDEKAVSVSKEGASPKKPQFVSKLKKKKFAAPVQAKISSNDAGSEKKDKAETKDADKIAGVETKGVGNTETVLNESSKDGEAKDGNLEEVKDKPSNNDGKETKSVSKAKPKVKKFSVKRKQTGDAGRSTPPKQVRNASKADENKIQPNLPSVSKMDASADERKSDETFTQYSNGVKSTESCDEKAVAKSAKLCTGGSIIDWGKAEKQEMDSDEEFMNDLDWEDKEPVTEQVGKKLASLAAEDDDSDPFEVVEE